MVNDVLFCVCHMIIWWSCKNVFKYFPWSQIWNQPWCFLFSISLFRTKTLPLNRKNKRFGMVVWWSSDRFVKTMLLTSKRAMPREHKLYVYLYGIKLDYRYGKIFSETRMWWVSCWTQYGFPLLSHAPG